MKRCIILIAVLAILAGGLSTAKAQVFLDDNFDGYASQAAFEANWTPIGCGAANGAICTPPNPLPGGTLSQDTAVSPANSILIHSPIGAPGSADSAQRNQRVFGDIPAVTTTTQIVWSYDFYDIDFNQNPYRQFSNLQDTTAPSGTNQLVAIGLNNNQLKADSGGNFFMARVLGFTPTEPTVGAGYTDPDGGPNERVTGASQFIKLNDFVLSPIRTTGWHNLKTVITTDDGLSTDYAFYVDGILSEKVSNVGTTASIRQYDSIRMGAGVSSAQDSYYDNMKVEILPLTVANNGDFNGDHVVDARDYTIWRDNEGTGTDKAHGDADLNGVVNGADYTIWAATYGTAVGSSAVVSTVPEPTTLIMLIAGLAMFAAGRRR